MKEVVVLSGKGGTGKTSLTAVLAGGMEGVVVVDCDVDAANLHLVMAPEVRERHWFWGGVKAQVDEMECAGCGVCVERCRAGAIEVGAAARVDEMKCEGCGVCAWVCPGKAIEMAPRMAGEWRVSGTAAGTMLDARLEPGEDNSGKLVALLRREGRARAEAEGAGWVLVDGPPGAGCPAISALTGADYVVFVTEPTVSGFSDLKRAAAVADHFKVRSGVVINKADLNGEMAGRIEEYAAETGRAVLGRIGYDGAFGEAQRAGVVVMEKAGEELRAALLEMRRAVEVESLR